MQPVRTFLDPFLPEDCLEDAKSESSPISIRCAIDFGVLLGVSSYGFVYPGSEGSEDTVQDLM